MQARQSFLKLQYNNKDISKSLASYLLGWTYTDYMSGAIDDLQINLEDKAHLWNAAWMPSKGATLRGTITLKNWEAESSILDAAIGLFEVDTLNSKGPPSVVTIKALAIPESSSLRGEDKNKAWEKTKLRPIAQELVSKAGMKLFYDTSENPEYDRMEQTGETDLLFLFRLCKDAGLCLKVTNGQVAIFDEQKYEAKPPITTITRGKSLIEGHDFTTTMNEIYAACKVSYQDGDKKQKIEATFTAPKSPGTKRTLYINERVKDKAEAQKLAKKKLREKNREATIGKFQLMGHPKYTAGATVMVKGFGWFDGKYIITQATHSKSGKYSTSIDIRRCLEGY